jgi:hypothetical protein
MCLRNSPELTPELVAGARRNGQRSAGPRSEAGKQNSNAPKHGRERVGSTFVVVPQARDRHEASPYAGGGCWNTIAKK